MNDKIQTVNVQISNRIDIARFTGLPIEEITEPTILQLGPYISEADHLRIVEELRQDNDRLRAASAPSDPQSPERMSDR